jgi:hypothetical protein
MRAKFRKSSINKDNAERLLRLLSFFEEKLLPPNKKPDFKLFCYGPSINGLTTYNQIQFSIDVTNIQGYSN